MSAFIAFFYAPIHKWIWSTIATVFPWHELTETMVVMPLGGEFKLMASTVLLTFSLFMSPVVALVASQDQISKKTIAFLFIFLSLYTITVAFIGVIGYYYYFLYMIVPSHDASFTLLDIPLIEFGIFTFFIVVSSTYIFFKKSTLVTEANESTRVMDHSESIEKSPRTYSKPISPALSIIILYFLGWLNIVISIIILSLFVYSFTLAPEAMLFSFAILGEALGTFIGLVFALLLFLTARGLSNHKQWAKITTIIFGGFILFGFPIGTILGILLIYGVTKGWPEDDQDKNNNSLETNQKTEPAF